MALTARLQRHSAGQFDDSDGTVHSKNMKCTTAVITRGQICTRDAGTDARVAVATDLPPVYIANTSKVLNARNCDLMWGDDVIFYVISDGAVQPYGDVECGALGKAKAAGGTNQVIGQYVKHGTKTVDGVTDLTASADGDVIGIKLLNRMQ